MRKLASQIEAAARQASSKLAKVTLDPHQDFYAQGLDSLDHVQILMKIEESFGFRFADTDYDTCNSLANIEAFMTARGLG